MPIKTEQFSCDEVDRIVGGAECVVFDFHLTLCSDMFFASLGKSTLARTERLLWGDDQTLSDKWMAGQVKAPQIADYLSGHLGISPSEIEDALRRGCREFELNMAVWDFARAASKAGKRMALVTVNADVFTEEVVPSFGLDGVFEIIVNSADCGEVDKLNKLWPVAFDALGGGISFSNSFLIEDGVDSPTKFTQAGGKAYQYTDDATFATWLDDRRR